MAIGVYIGLPHGDVVKGLLGEREEDVVTVDKRLPSIEGARILRLHS